MFTRWGEDNNQSHDTEWMWVSIDFLEIHVTPFNNCNCHAIYLNISVSHLFRLFNLFHLSFLHDDLRVVHRCAISRQLDRLGNDWGKTKKEEKKYQDTLFTTITVVTLNGRFNLMTSFLRLTLTAATDDSYLMMKPANWSSHCNNGYYRGSR